jgi:hypothetical protein
LLVEDDPDRYEKFAKWAPPDVRLVWARTGGIALSILDKDRGSTYQGILLDHDLDKNPIVPADSSIDGRRIAQVITQTTSPCVPVMIHSMNPCWVPTMSEILTKAGFVVDVKRMADLNRKDFTEWIDLCRDTYETF